MIEKKKAYPSPKLLKRFCKLIGFNHRLAMKLLYEDKIEEFSQKLEKRLKKRGL